MTTNHPLDTPWYSGEGPPDDWDGDTTTLVYRGTRFTYYSAHLWNHDRRGGDRDFDII